MAIRVEYIGAAARATGTAGAEIEGVDGSFTVRRVLETLDARTEGRLLRALGMDDSMTGAPASFGVFVNGRNYHLLDGLDTPVADGDVVVVGTLLSGG